MRFKCYFLILQSNPDINQILNDSELLRQV